MSMLRKLLFPLSLLFYIVQVFRNFLYDKNIIANSKFNIPIISVGNLSVGGTGKTPMVEYLLAKYIEKYKIAILSRGYKRKSKGFVKLNEKSDISYVLGLNGLRAIAVLMVLLSHFLVDFSKSLKIPIGVLGVDIFFVLSGYLISRILFHQLRFFDPNKISRINICFRFLKRRASRIFPIYYLTLLVLIPIAQYIQKGRFSNIGITNKRNSYKLTSVPSLYSHLLVYLLNFLF